MLSTSARFALLVALVGCNAISGVGDLDFPGASAGGGGGSSPQAASSSAGDGGAAASTGSGTSVSAASSSSSGVGATGGGPSSCGNGVIDPDEECDSGSMAQVGCDQQCKVVCDGAHDVLDATSHHCYYFDPTDAQLAWLDARLFCQATWGGDLLILETMAEYQALLPGFPTPPAPVYFWTGGNDLATNGQYVWWDGSAITYPFNMPPWMAVEPNDNGDCIVWRADSSADAEGIGDLPCANNYHPFCERKPPGG